MTARIWSETAGQGRDLTLIHGWGMNASVWSALLPELRQDYRVTVLDLPGHGNSADASFSDLPSLSSQILDVLPEKTVLLGWSLGGLVALWLASLESERFGRALLVSSSPCFVQRPGWPAALEHGVFDAFSSGLEQDYMATLKRFLALQLKGAEDARNLARSLGAGLNERPPQKQALVQGLGVLNDEDQRSRLCALGGRVSILLGGRDTLVPSGMARELASVCPEADVEVLQDAGHMPFVTHPTQFQDWLARKVNE